MELFDRRIVFCKQDRDYLNVGKDCKELSFCTCNKEGPLICECGEEENDSKCKYSFILLLCLKHYSPAL